MVYIDKETNELAYQIIGCAYKVHKELGPGLLESTYEACLCYELNKLGIGYERQKELPVIYDNTHIDCGYRIDIMVERKNHCRAKDGRATFAYPYSPNYDLPKIKRHPFRTINKFLQYQFTKRNKKICTIELKICVNLRKSAFNPKNK